MLRWRLKLYRSTYSNAWSLKWWKITKFVLDPVQFLPRELLFYIRISFAIKILSIVDLFTELRIFMITISLFDYMCWLIKFDILHILLIVSDKILLILLHSDARNIGRFIWGLRMSICFILKFNLSKFWLTCRLLWLISFGSVCSAMNGTIKRQKRRSRRWRQSSRLNMCRNTEI